MRVNLNAWLSTRRRLDGGREAPYTAAGRLQI